MRPNGWREESRTIYLNKPSDIVANRNKMAAIQRFRSSGVDAPEVYTIDDITNPTKNITFPIIGRRTSHQGGSDAIICLDRTTAKKAASRGQSPSQFFVKYIPKTEEYRVHIFASEFFMGSKKIHNNDTSNPISDYIWSSNNGWTFTNERPENIPDEAKRIAIAAIRASNLMFGAVDVIKGEDNGFYVLEVNSGPSLIERRADLYADKFKSFILAQS
jgi:glutathione synthase/RimK-type ligase-like ATP-grasp enzyme